jgi:CMP-N-acetylneuraminic acid synthetase
VSAVLAIVPARLGSKGVPGKNFRPLAGLSPLTRAVLCAHAACGTWPVVTSDADQFTDGPDADCRWLQRPPALAQDDTPMSDVVRHVLEAVPGPKDEIIVLLQPTQPLRTVAHVRAAIALLQSSGADSVVSVAEVPDQWRPDTLCEIDQLPGHPDQLTPYRWWCECGPGNWATIPATRQAAGRAWYRDGTVYAFTRATIVEHGTIYGEDVRPLIIKPEDTCPLDTPAEWAEAERRIRAVP